MRKSKAHIIQGQIDALEVELEAYQAKCKHPRAIGVAGSSTGNYDGHENYWINWTCPTCLYEWMADDDD